MFVLRVHTTVCGCKFGLGVCGYVVMVIYREFRVGCILGGEVGVDFIKDGSHYQGGFVTRDNLM